MATFTLYVLPSGNLEKDNPERAADSFGDIPTVTQIVPHGGGIDLVNHQTDWFGFIYADEVIDERLREAIPVFLDHAPQDCLTLFKMTKDNKCFLGMRIFRRWVTLAQNNLRPAEPGASCERILNGFIWEQ